MKIAMFTDIHWGARSNSIQHNQDCADFIEWFILLVKSVGVDAIVFMGDWFENRNAVNVFTLNSSFDSLRKLNNLNLPIYFCIGNHDLYFRANRQQFSTYHVNQFENVNVISEPTVIKNLAFFPFLFRNEYSLAAELLEKHKTKYAFGHFEFRNFYITGSDRRLEHGPDHSLFTQPTYIFSGHFHRRQVHDNIIYIGNTFPTNYGDAWDDARGACVLDTESEDVSFIDWLECPKFRKVKLSDILTDTSLRFPAKCRVRCIIDRPISYSEAQSLREEMIKQLDLREFTLEDNTQEKKQVITGEENQDVDVDLSSLNDTVIKLLTTGITDTSIINPNKLVEIYETL